VPTNQPIGTIAQIQSNAAKTVYIGFGFDNFGELYVNNQKIVSITTIAEQDAVAANIGAILGGSYPGSAVLFRFWQIVPVQLQAGQNIIQVININTSSSGCFGMEIYDNTAAEIAAATSYADLTMLYRSIDAVGTDLF
jgi:hypothetical protein